MSTKDSPPDNLRAEAAIIAQTLKRAERREPLQTGMLTAKMVEARLRPTFKTGIAMDDKIVTIELAWTKIAATTEEALTEYILGLMQENRDAQH